MRRASGIMWRRCRWRGDVLSQGNRGVILCERGIKTFEDSIRYTMDITSIPVATQWSHLPAIVDPSHAAGERDYVAALPLAGRRVEPGESRRDPLRARDQDF